MRWITGRIELRRAGAIGVFTSHPCRTQADSLEKAVEYLIDDAHAYGYEPLIVSDLKAVTKLEYDNSPNAWQDGDER